MADKPDVESNPEVKIDPPEPAPVDPPVPPKQVSQDDINRIMAKERRHFEKKLQEIRDQHEKEMLSLKEKQKEDPPAPDDLRGQMELMERKHKREVEGLTTRQQELEKTLAAEKQRRLETERDRELSEALSVVGCIDGTAGRRYFLPEIEFDEESTKWMYRTAKGNLVSIADGVAEAMPPYLRPAKLDGGGSGSSKGGSTKATRAKQLEEAKRKLADLYDTTRKSGAKQSDINAYTQQKRLVQRLESEVASA